ncbi:O-antigen ligase family protein [Microlunatus antarcticus]|uniref:O-antigen ligase n=1 Tax=Microlunatus antarcticus TaxID=53388 RepID=A0A7W5JS23_9ACTN|nr:O-antigen ligase [Microlunatus antarcticus]
MVAPPSRTAGWTHDRASVLFLLVGLWAIVPKILQTLTAAKYRVRVDQAAPPPSAVTVLATDLLTLALLGYCLLVVLDALRSNVRRDLLGPVLLLAPWAWVEVRGFTLDAASGVSDLVYPAVVVAVWLVRPGLRHLRLLGYLAAAVALVSIVIGVGFPDQGVFRSVDGSAINEEKAILPFGVLVGVFTHGNTLGQYLLMGLPLIALVPRRGLRAVLLAVTAGALLWSAARSTIAGAVALALVVAVLSLLPPGRRSVPYRLVLGGAFALVAVLPFVTRAPLAFTGRGAIWSNSLGYWREHPWVGNGSDFYTRIARTTADLGGTVYHGHNETVQLLVTGGVVLVVLVGLLLVAVIRRATDERTGGTIGLAILLALAGASLLEVSLLFDDSGAFDPVLLLPLATLLVGEPLGEAARAPRAVEHRLPALARG